MMNITGLSHLFKWENLHNWWLTKYFFAPLYIYLKNLLKCFTLHVMNIEYMKVSLFEISCKKNELFHHILIF